MSSTGKEIRLRRILDGRSSKTVIVPMDHGVSVGPIQGLEDVRSTISKVAKGGATAIIIHKGLVPTVQDYFGNGPGLIVHLSASLTVSAEPNLKVLVGDVREAIALGADAVSVHTNFGGDGDDRMVSDLGMISGQCARFGIPLLCMVYPRGKNIKNSFDVDVVKHGARLAAELGSDIVKTNYTGSPETFKEVVSGCPVPVVIAGGPKMDSDRAVLEMVKGAMSAGAKGVSIGRNIFQHHDVTGMTRAIARIVFEDADVDEVYRW